MTHYNLALIGFGNVARALARLLERKQGLLESQYDITYSITGIATGSHGFAVIVKVTDDPFLFVRASQQQFHFDILFQQVHRAHHSIEDLPRQ